MARIVKEVAPSRSLLSFFGAEVRRLREQAGLSQAALGGALFLSKDLISKIEGADRSPTRAFVAQCDVALGAGGSLKRLWPMLERERELQAARRPSPAPAAKKFSSGATDRPVLDWLLTAPAPAAANHDRSPGHDQEIEQAAVVLFGLRSADQTQGAGQIYPQLAGFLGPHLDVLATQGPGVATGFLELAGYEAVDLGADGRAQQHYLRALEIVTRSGDRLYGGYLIAVSLAHLALHCGDTGQAALLVRAAIEGTQAEASPAVRAAFGSVLARVYAREGDRAACLAALDRAETDLAASTPGEEPGWISYFGPADLADEKAHCYFDLGMHDLAQREVTAAIAALEPARARRLAIDTALLASSLARCGEIENACAVGRLAVGHTASTTSFRSAHRIVLMMAELQPYADVPAVRDLAEYMHAVLPPIQTLMSDGSLRWGPGVDHGTVGT